MSTKFVKNAVTVNFCTALALVWGEGEESLRPAVTKGGVVSRSGLTYTPTWVEEGAFPLLRKREYMIAVLNGKEPGIWYFTGHGAREYEIKTAPERLRPALLAWQGFRKTGGSLPEQETEEGRMARNFSLGAFRDFCHLTSYEAEEMLPRFSEWAVMEEDDDTTYIHTPLGTAYKNNDWREYLFCPQGHVCEWKDSEGEGWSYKNTYRCTATAQRWYLERWKAQDGQHLHEWEITEDKRDWTTCHEHVDFF